MAGPPHHPTVQAWPTGHEAWRRPTGGRPWARAIILRAGPAPPVGAAGRRIAFVPVGLGAEWGREGSPPPPSAPRAFTRPVSAPSSAAAVFNAMRWITPVALVAPYNNSCPGSSISLARMESTAQMLLPGRPHDPPEMSGEELPPSSDHTLPDSAGCSARMAPTFITRGATPPRPRGAVLGQAISPLQGGAGPAFIRPGWSHGEPAEAGPSAIRTGSPRTAGPPQSCWQRPGNTTGWASLGAQVPGDGLPDPAHPPRHRHHPPAQGSNTRRASDHGGVAPS